MRKSLLTAAAMAPLLLGAAAAHATTTISTAVTTPVKTSTAANGQPDDVVIGTAGAINVNSGAAVTVDTNNLFTNNGVISFTDAADNSTGVLVLTPHNGSIVSTGRIELDDGYTATDTNEDGIPDGPFAEGSGRYGIRIMGPGVFNGSLTQSGAVTVEGNDSFGISVESAMEGDIDLSGSLKVIGDRSTAFAETGGVDGKITLSGGISATGKDAVAVDLGGDVSGSLRIYAAILATGYRVTERITNPDILAGLKPENIQQSGAAVQVRGNVAGGIFIGGPPPSTTTPAAGVDLDKDGIDDKDEATGSISVFGNAPALLIGDAGKDIDIGAFGTAENAYGLIVRGGIHSFGIYDGVASNAVEIGAAGGSVNIAGGIRVVGSIATQSYKADSKTIHVLSGAQANALKVEGAVSAVVFSDIASSATAVQVDQGGSITSLNNSGNLTAALTGNLGSAYAVDDRSGQLTSILNTGTIAAQLLPAATGGTTAGRAIALNLSANTTGVSIVQDVNANSTTAAPIVSHIVGDILLGSGSDTVDLRTGTVSGALDFGTGGGGLRIDGGAVYTGALDASEAISVDLVKGTLDNRSSTALQVTDLSVGSEGNLVLSVDPANSAAGRIDVAGTATFADGGKLGVSIASLPTQDQSFRLIDAGALDIQGAGLSLGSSPYLVVAALDVDEAAGHIDVDIRRRTAAEAGFNTSQAAAYDAVYNELPTDSAILGAFLAQTTREGLVGLYDQMLPDHAGGVLRAMSWAQEASSRGAADWPRNDSENLGPTRAWTQEIGVGEKKSAGDAAAWNVYGFGAVGGVESISPSGSAVGMLVNFATANVTNPDSVGDDLIGVSQIGLGVYWRGAYGGLHTDLQAGAGYVTATGRREFIGLNGSTVVHRLTEADWNGYSVYGRAGLAYDWTTGRLAITPAVHLDYYRLFEGGYSETGGGPGFDLDVDSRTSDILTLTPTLTLGYTFGDKFKYRPEIEVGWRQVLAGSSGVTSGHFHGAATPFDLFGEDVSGGAPIVRVGFRVFSGWLDVKVDAGGEFRDGYTDLDLRLTARMIF